MATSSITGYSGKPLASKLGFKPGFRLLILNPPAGYWDWVGNLPSGILLVDPQGDTRVDLAHCFVRSTAELERVLQTYRQRLIANGMLWISWPKKASKIHTDLDENKIRNLGLRYRLVDVKVIAINEVWSGLKFVFRLADR